MAKKVAKSGHVVQYWLSEIKAARKREKDYRKDGERILDIYEGKKASTTPFNILFSNTETMLPALYSTVPRPVVDRRFKDEDPLGKHAALAGTRILSFLLDTNVDGYETFDDGMRAATLDGLLPGRGVTCVKYDADIGELASEDEPTQYKQSELACLDSRSWNRVFFGYAKKWSKVPWVAYEEHIDRDEAERLFGAEIAAKLVYTECEDAEADDKNKEDDDKGERKTALVYQVWDKAGGRKIRYVCEQYKDGFLKVQEDPLGLTGFFNCPRPLQFLEKSNDLLPVALYVLYENQAKELNKLTQRINRIVDAIKARGVYDTELGEDIANIMKADDNTLMPADKTASIAAEGGLQNAIWFWPVEKLIVVLRELYVARESCKQVIYEITGIADIMRGQTNASETLGAQQIKQSWGTLRLKRLQKEVQRYARDLLRMMLEIAATKFSEETWAKMTGLPFVTTDQRAQLDQIAQAAQMTGQQLDPQTQAALQAPVWGQVLEMLRDDTQRAYRIDIETNSTIEPEAVEDQKNITELMTAIGQYLNGIGPLVAKGVMPFEAAQSMLLAIVRRYRFGSEIEDQIRAMKAPPPPDDGKAAEQQKMTMEKQKFDAEMAKDQQDSQQKQAELAMKAEFDREKVAAERERLQMEMQAAREEHAYKMEQMQAKRQLDAFITASKLEVARVTAEAKKAQALKPKEPA